MSRSAGQSLAEVLRFVRALHNSKRRSFLVSSVATLTAQSRI